MKPKFSMVSDSTDPNIETCTGHWEFVGGGGMRQKFQTSKECFAMDYLVQEAYEQGLADGIKQAKSTINAALSNI